MPGIPCDGCPRTFLELLDTPTSYIADKIVSVNSDATGLTFIDLSSYTGLYTFNTINDARTYLSDNYLSIISDTRVPVKLVFIRETGQLYYVQPDVDHDSTDHFASYYIPGRNGVIKLASGLYYFISSSASGSGHHPADPFDIDNFYNSIQNIARAKKVFIEVVDSTATLDFSSVSPSETPFFEEVALVLNNLNSNSEIIFGNNVFDARAVYVFAKNARSSNIELTIRNLENIPSLQKIYIFNNGLDVAIHSASNENLNVEIEGTQGTKVSWNTTEDELALGSVSVNGPIFIPHANTLEGAVKYPIQYNDVVVYGDLEFVPYTEFYFDWKPTYYSTDMEIFRIFGRRRMALKRVYNSKERSDVVEVLLTKDTYPVYAFYCPFHNFVHALSGGYYAVIAADVEILAEGISSAPIAYDDASNDYYYYLEEGQEYIIKIPPKILKGEAIVIEVDVYGSGTVHLETKGGYNKDFNSSVGVACLSWFRDELGQLGDWIKLTVSGSSHVLVKNFRVYQVSVK